MIGHPTTSVPGLAHEATFASTSPICDEILFLNSRLCPLVRFLFHHNIQPRPFHQHRCLFERPVYTSLKESIPTYNQKEDNNPTIQSNVLAHFPLQIIPSAPPSTSPTTFSAKTSACIILPKTGCSPLALAATSFSILRYLDEGGSLKWLAPSLPLKMSVSTPMITMTTLTPKGASSRRRVSLMAVLADFEPA